ncbi:hypothetical protein BV898_09070 [Hypsibius exemplaris]|uniref:Nucleotide exchange factor SIL1 n=1 Tax=Hypsibius exemplaris TaxID=2072580 RepID=A0A1W0WNV8_HYPEX|nr:hypothetical protein BV898_09070 [Hypsibius exemplaris]
MERNSNPQPKDLLNMAIQASVEVGKAEDTAGMNEHRPGQADEILPGGTGSPEADETQKSHSLDVLLSLTESIDVANDLFKIGGFPVLQACLTGSESGQSRGRRLSSTLVRPNGKETQPQTRIKLLSALSSLLRSSPEAQRAFEQLDGLSALLRCMISSKDGKFQTSAAFMLSRVCSENAAFIDHLAKMGFVHHFVALLQKETASRSGGSTSPKSSPLFCGTVRWRDKTQRSGSDLPAFLQQRQKEIAGQEEFQEESEVSRRS